jgi:hypothetical protein
VDRPVGGEQFVGNAQVVRRVPLDVRAVAVDELLHDAEHGPALIKEVVLDLYGICGKYCRDPCHDDWQDRRVAVGLERADHPAYVIGFVALFIISGIGNGSVYKMIPAIFAGKSLHLPAKTSVEAAAWARAMSGALIGIAGAIGALGVGINLVQRASYAGEAKSATMAFWVFLGFYLVCGALTWFVYVRPANHGRPDGATIAETPAVAGMTPG